MRFHSYRDYYYDGEDPRRLPRSKFKRKGRRSCRDMVSGWTLVKISLVLCFTSLFLQILGYSCPGWMILTIDLAGLADSANSGLFGFGKIMTYAAVWYVRVCIRQDLQETCSSSSYHESSFMGLQLSNALSDLASIDWIAIEVETTIALALCLAGIILCVICLCEPCPSVSPKVWCVVAAGLMFASGILLLPVVISFSEAIDKTNDAVRLVSEVTGRDFIEVETPWAMALTASGMVLAYICCFLLLIAACKHNERTSGFIRPDNSDSGYSYRRYPFVVPTMFSSYPAMPITELQYQDRPRLPPLGHRNAEIPATYSEFPVSYGERGEFPGFGPYVIYAPTIGRFDNSHGRGEELLQDSPPPVYAEYDKTRQ